MPGFRYFSKRGSVNQDRIRLPGSLQEQGFGHEVGVDTKWTGGIVDRFRSPGLRIFASRECI